MSESTPSSAETQTNAARTRELNDTIRYTMWSVFRLRDVLGDEALVAVSLAELAALAGVTARPVDSHVQRWGGALPQYAVGHLDRVARIRTAVAGQPGLAVCGAAYDGVGIPAVIGSARQAVASVTRAE